MAAIAVTYTFSNSTTADATQVNQNFTDLVNGLSDGTKDISVNAGTFAGNVSISGNTTLGNASGDDITMTGSLASSIPIKTTNTYDIGSSTLGLRALYFGANSQTVKVQGSSSMSATWTLTLPVTAGTDGYYLKTNGSGVSSWQAFTPPTIQKFTTGTGTYTTPANVKYIRVRMVGGGGGGAGSGVSGGGAGSAGGTTTFGTTFLVADGGNGGLVSSAGTDGAGGSSSFTAPAIGTSGQGGGGGGGGYGGATSNAGFPGGYGGSSPLGQGAAPNSYSTAGRSAAANSGGGGSGGSGTTAANAGYAGGGGGSGGWLDVIIPSPSATYGYAVGAVGTKGTAGTTGFDGGDGGSGYIEVTEYYS